MVLPTLGHENPPLYAPVYTARHLPCAGGAAVSVASSQRGASGVGGVRGSEPLDKQSEKPHPKPKPRQNMQDAPGGRSGRSASWGMQPAC
jgi:hypothetical protein